MTVRFPQFLIASVCALCNIPSAAQTAPVESSKNPYATAPAATVIIVAGEGAGRLHGIATGVVISKDGSILTALHAVRGAQELQVRLPNGEVYDHVVMTGSDERRDIASLKIPAGGLAFLVPAESQPTQGQQVYAVTNADGLSFSATSGILSAIRPSDEVTGAGSGYRLLQFTDPIAPGASGGALVDQDAHLLGIIVGKTQAGAGFAIPIDSIYHLSDSGLNVRFGTGSQLNLPTKTAQNVPQSSAAIANEKPRDILRDAKAIYIHSKTSFLTVDTLDRALLLQKGWDKLGITLVSDPRVADLIIEIDRPLFTYVHTFVITDKRTSIILGSGKQTAFDGTIASGGLAKDIVAIFAAARAPEKPK